MNRTNEICRGCWTRQYLHEHNLKCAFMTQGKERICPCIECLIKVICRIDCEERDRLMRNMEVYRQNDR